MRRITKFIYLPAMLMVAAASAWAWDGSGTSEVPYLIKTSADMNALATNVNNGTDYAGTYFRMENNLEYDGTENNYTAIGLYDDTEVSRPFCGIFDGNGKTISGININKDDTPAQGLFGNIGKGAIIRNVTLTNSTITGLYFVGGIVGHHDRDSSSGSTITTGIGGGNTGTKEAYAIIENCVVGSDVTVTGTDDSGAPVGVGGILGAGTFLDITNCVSAATLVGAHWTGGIVGELYTDPDNALLGVISNCLYIGSSVSGTDEVGAIIGENDEGYGTAHSLNLYYGCTVTKDGTDYTADCGMFCGSFDDDGNMTSSTFDDMNTGDGARRAVRLDVLPDGIPEGNYLSYGGKYYIPAGVFFDAADNTTLVSAVNNQKVTAELRGRTLYKDGSWNTLCLPFAVSSFSGTPLEGATVKTLTSSSFSGGTLTMNFTEDANNLTAIQAGQPYIVKWASGDNIVNPVFSGVTVSSTTANVSADYVDFIGTYSPVGIYTAEKTILYLGSANNIYYPTREDYKVNSCRAYFQLKDGLMAGAPTSEAPIRAFILNFGDESTGIVSVSKESGSEGAATGWFTLDGRRLSGKPTAKGLYIRGNKKILVK